MLMLLAKFEYIIKNKVTPNRQYSHTLIPRKLKRETVATYMYYYIVKLVPGATKCFIVAKKRPRSFFFFQLTSLRTYTQHQVVELH